MTIENLLQKYLNTSEVDSLLSFYNRLFKIIGLCCKRALLKRLYSASEVDSLSSFYNKNLSYFLTRTGEYSQMTNQHHLT